MKNLIGLMIVLAIVATPSLAQKITIDYAHEFDFSKVKTFAYVETEDTNTGNSLTDDRIKNAILRELREGGLELVESDADLYVTYHIATKDITSFNTTSFGYGGWGPGWGGYGGWGYGGSMGSSTTTATTYTEGTLIIDAYEPGEKKMVWRGTGTVTVKEKPEKQAKQIDKILTKMGSKWDKIIANKGK
jgi:hypothetical protein